MKVQRFMNVTGLTFTPSGGAPAAVDGVKEVRIDPRARAVGFAGGLDVFPSGKRVAFADPLVTAEAVESGSMDGVDVGSEGVLSFVANDAAAGSAPGGGGRRAVVSPAIYMGSTRANPHRRRACRCLTFETRSPDGRTDPVRWAPV